MVEASDFICEQEMTIGTQMSRTPLLPTLFQKWYITTQVPERWSLSLCLVFGKGSVHCYWLDPSGTADNPQRQIISFVLETTLVASGYLLNNQLLHVEVCLTRNGYASPNHDAFSPEPTHLHAAKFMKCSLTQQSTRGWPFATFRMIWFVCEKECWAICSRCWCTGTQSRHTLARMVLKGQGALMLGSMYNLWGVMWLVWPKQTCDWYYEHHPMLRWHAPRHQAWPLDTIK